MTQNVLQGNSRGPLEISLQTMSLRDLFGKNLNIPPYQRSYSWRSNHVQDLLNDIYDCKSPYLMGTVILHKTEDDKFDIVDGQQRLVTLTILMYALKINTVACPILQGKFSAGAAEVIQKAYEAIQEFILADDRQKKLQSLLVAETEEQQDIAHLQFHVVTLSGAEALDRAYTFFDSVNSKGKALSDFDLLKAHHLMFIPPKQEILATHHNADWLMRDEIHANLFSNALRRIRMWARGQDRDDKQEWADYNEFSSVVDPDHEEDIEHVFNRYMQPAAFRSWRRVGDKIVLSMDYPVSEGETMVPTEITQTIEGGDTFFIYTKRYHNLYESLFNKGRGNHSATAFCFVRSLSDRIDNAYLRDAFRAVMLLFVDKFGEDRLVETSVCVERIISAWRWKAKSLRIEGTLTHVRDKRLVPILLESVNSRHAYEQILRIAQSVPRNPPTDVASGSVRARYRDLLSSFYRNESSKITDVRARYIALFFIGNQ
jgi:hypothetical protein